MSDARPHNNLREEYVAPRSDTERTLAAIWKQVLGVDKIGIYDRFAELGGDSLRATYVLATIEDKMGVTVTVTEFYMTQTIAALADLIEKRAKNPEKPRYEHLVMMQPAGSLKPLFLLHAVDGDAFTYSNLVKSLGDERPIYAFQANYNLDFEEQDFKVENMARKYIKELIDVQPHGPYHLSGFSLGGVIAYEMAQQLKASGEETAFLGIIDIEAPHPRNTVAFYTRRKAFLRELIFLFEDLKPDSRRRRTGRDVKLSLRAKIILRLGLSAVGLMRPPQEVLIPSTVYKYPERRQRMWIRMMKTAYSYIAKPYEGQVVVFRGDTPQFARSPDRTMGWEKLVRGDLKIIDIPGRFHGSQLKPPYVYSLAKKMNKMMAIIQA
ncbi:MAG: thioesterase domain-containing protein [Candidatus Methanomethylicaceae archaeon]